MATHRTTQMPLKGRRAPMARVRAALARLAHRERPPALYVYSVRRREQADAVAWAAAHGYGPPVIWAERSSRSSADLEMMIATAYRDRVHTVAVRSVTDLGAQLPTQRVARRTLQAAGLRLVVMDDGA